jgi:hypothetical protein
VRVLDPSADLPQRGYPLHTNAPFNDSAATVRAQPRCTFQSQKLSSVAASGNSYRVETCVRFPLS